VKTEEEIQEEIQKVKNGVAAAEKAVKAEDGKIKASKDKIRRANEGIEAEEKKIEGFTETLLKNQSDEKEAIAERDKLLDDIAREFELTIEADSSAVQGSLATFRAKYVGDLPANVEVAWDTGGCPIVRDNKAKKEEEVTVNTSSVQPGDYGISVFLKIV
jgi:hypothetical protein